jgi:hypothetical protein
MIPKSRVAPGIGHYKTPVRYIGVCAKSKFPGDVFTTNSKGGFEPEPIQIGKADYCNRNSQARAGEPSYPIEALFPLSVQQIHLPE